MSSATASGVDDEPNDDPERIEQVRYLAKRLKIPRWEADRLLANMEADERGESA